MAVQLPNFLGVPVREPDYSSLGNIFENYYAGKNLPRQDIINEYTAKSAPLDYLMKQIQAEFARPSAEQALKGSKLANEIKQVEADFARPNAEQYLSGSKLDNLVKQVQAEFARPNAEQNLAGLRLGNKSTSLANTQAEMTIKQLQKALADEAEFQALLKQSVGKGSTGESGVRQQQNDKALQDSLAGVMSHQAMKNQPAPTAAPQMNDHPADKDNVQQLDAGTPSHYGLDEMWENRPEMRSLMEKKGFKKEVKDEYDKKTGATRIRTKWPSGRVTIKTIPAVGRPEGEGIPLTSSMITRNQKIISSVDVALPTIKELGEMGSYPRQSLYKGGQYGDYQGLVAQAVDSIMGAFGLPNTNEGLQTARDQVEIRKFETPSHYKKRMEKLSEDLIKRKNYSAKEVKRSDKISPVSSGNEESYSSNEWEVTNE